MQFPNNSTCCGTSPYMANTNFCGCGNDYPIVPGTNPALQTWNGQAFVVADGSAQNRISLPFLQVNGGAATYVVGADNNGVWSYYSPNLSPNLAGGAAGQVPWQISTNVTGFTATGTSGQLLQSGGTGSPTWITPNNLLVTATGSTTARTLANRFADVLNVKDFGAVGDGTTDDSIAIQDAINYCAANSITLFVQSGTYRLLNYITFPSNINIYGEIGSNFYFDPSMTLSPSVGGSQRAYYSQNTNNVFISQIRFYSSATTSKIIQGVFLNVDGIRLTNCQFDTFGNVTYYAQGLLLFTCTNVFVDGCIFSNNSGDGLAFSNTCQNIFISNTEANNNGDYGIVFTIDCKKISVIGCNFLNNTNTNLGADRCSDVVFSSNVSEGSDYGIRVARYVDTTDINSSIVILGNVVRGALVHGISITNSEGSPFSNSGYVCVTSNSVYSCSTGIYIGDIRDVSVSSNVIYNSTNEGIIVIAFNSGQTTENVSVIGNTVDTATYGIRQLTVSGTMGKIAVSGNVISNTSVAPLVTTNADVFDGNTSANYINVSKSLSFPAAVVYSTTASGGAVIPPAQIYGYISVYLDGSLKKIPVYNS